MIIILAGIFIALSTIIYLNIGGYIGAVMFAVGLCAVFIYDLKLFTGKMRLLPLGQIKLINLLQILALNFCGTFIVAGCIQFSPRAITLTEQASRIAANRIANQPWENFILAVPTGILMSLAAYTWNKYKSIWIVFICVPIFVVMGWPHIIADFTYFNIFALGGITFYQGLMSVLTWLIPVFAGNLFGGCLFKILNKYFPEYI